MALFTNSEKAVVLHVPEAAADRLAQLLKRLTWTDVRSCAADEEEAHELMRAVPYWVTNTDATEKLTSGSTAEAPQTAGLQQCA